MSDPRLLSTLVNGLEILETVAILTGDGPVSARDIAEYVGVKRTTVYTYLHTLREVGYLEFGSNPSEYRLGPRIVRIASSYLAGLDIRRQSRSFLEELVDKTSLTAHLVVLDGDSIVYLDKVEPDSPIQMRSKVGASAPAYCTASGKAILAFMPEEQTHRVIDAGLPRRTPNTITERTAFLEHLRQVRETGVAVDNVEFEDGIRCVAAPLFRFDGGVVAAISLTGLETDLAVDRVPELSKLVREAAQAISDRL